jgi:tetratricopeptide (TPR) repeat protein
LLLLLLLLLLLTVAMSSSSTTSRYDPNAIIASANERLRQTTSSGAGAGPGAGDLEEASLIFQSALLTWVDDARETSDPSLHEAVATLWLAYAQFLASAKQYKSSLEAYEQAAQCPVARHNGRVWLEYARFAVERRKPKTAQDVFVRALAQEGGPDAPNLDEQDRQLLWSEFLDLTRNSTSNPALTMEELQAAIHEQNHQGGSIGGTVIADDSGVEPDAASSLSASGPPLKRPRLALDSNAANDGADEVGESRTYVVTEDEVQSEAAGLTDILSNSALPDEIYGAWMAMDGNDAHLSAPPSMFQPAPPKLADPSGKDALGVDVALQLIQKLAEPGVGSVVLEVCKALWTLQAVTEEAGASAIDRFDSDMKEQASGLQANLTMRVSVSTAATRAAVQMMNDNEWGAFQVSVQQQRQSLLAQFVWERRKLLCIQQSILSKLGMPEFDGPTVEPYALDRQAHVCAYLHSAFYLRSRIGEQAHRTMLASLTKRLEKEYETTKPAAATGTSHSPVPHGMASASGRSPRLSPVPAGQRAHMQASPHHASLPSMKSLSPMNAANSNMYSLPPPHLQQHIAPPQFSYNQAPPLLPMPAQPQQQPPQVFHPMALNPTIAQYGSLPPPSGHVPGYPTYGGANGQPPSQYPYGNYVP